jgi:hypothetical protein
MDSFTKGDLRVQSSRDRYEKIAFLWLSQHSGVTQQAMFCYDLSRSILDSDLNILVNKLHCGTCNIHGYGGARYAIFVLHTTFPFHTRSGSRQPS